MLDRVVLQGGLARLEPLRLEHAAALEAAGRERGSYAYTWVPDGRDDAERYVQAALDHQASGRALVWVVRRLGDGLVVGSTRFLDLKVFTWPPKWPPGVGRGPAPTAVLPPSVAEIGSTWFWAGAQRTGINTDVKLLQLTYAFEVWQVLRVTLKTDARNAASRRAIERLGAQAEGVRRAHAPASDGTIRDTAYYSITQPEWPRVRDRLQRRLHCKPDLPPPFPGAIAIWPPDGWRRSSVNTGCMQTYDWSSPAMHARLLTAVLALRVDQQDVAFVGYELTDAALVVFVIGYGDSLRTRGLYRVVLGLDIDEENSPEDFARLVPMLVEEAVFSIGAERIGWAWPAEPRSPDQVTNR